ncbi:MAG: hypothetical protein IKK89_03675 [Alistipes sp.]|nr:hypothetical protein [Alistipes sp.]
MIYDYIIAGLRLRSDIDLVAIGIRGFQPFEVEANESVAPSCHFHIDTEFSEASITIEQLLSEFDVTEANAEGRFSRTTTGYLYSTHSRLDNKPATLFHIDLKRHDIVSNIVCQSALDISLLRFGLWMMFGVVLSENSAIAIHSSVIVSRERGLLFLGESGTGKSTHTRLWRENIEGATLLNDDSPIVRIVDGKALVFGSPWSGKTPCYKNLSYPIAGFCRLSQAPHNLIRRLHPLAAIGALLPSCPPAFAHDDYLQDGICNTLGALLKQVGAYHLECLPDKAAAELSFNTIICNAEGTR